MFVQNWVYRTQSERESIPVYHLFPVFSQPATLLWAAEQLRHLQQTATQIRASLEPESTKVCRAMQAELSAVRSCMTDSHTLLAKLIQQTRHVPTPSVPCVDATPTPAFAEDDHHYESDGDSISTPALYTVGVLPPSCYHMKPTRPRPKSVQDVIDHVFNGNFPRGSGNPPLLYLHKR